MKYQLIKDVNPSYSAYYQILTNRGIDEHEIEHYLNSTDDDINNPELFGEEILNEAAKTLISMITSNSKILVVVDCDCDGYTSAAVLLNYLHDLVPAYVENNLSFFIHGDKQHGLADCCDYIIENDFQCVICPDSSSNDYEYHEKLFEHNIPVIILDHHEAEKISEKAIVINNQLSNYPNKDLSGVGVVWQFCRFLDKKLNKSFADNYLDLVALGLTADMMSLHSIETKHLINKGFEQERIVNPFIFGMAEKNSYSLGEKITSIGAAFYIAPMVNAISRSGTLEEKELIFKSMLKYEAFKKIPSNKRGHKPGEVEQLFIQALRVSTNVKNRQTRAQDNGLDFIEHMIEDNNMLNHKVLLFLLEDNSVAPEIRGLIANKIMAKYQRPCCLLTKVEKPIGVFYQGSARGCEKVGVDNFKDICENTLSIDYAHGHQGAFGLSIPKDNIEKFIVSTDDQLAEMPDEAIYYVDYIFKNNQVDSKKILEIASMDSFWGKDMEESLVCVENLLINSDMVSVYEKKTRTLKIDIGEVSVVMFNADEGLCEQLKSIPFGKAMKMNLIGTCSRNEFMGKVTPQIIMKDFQLFENTGFVF